MSAKTEPADGRAGEAARWFARMNSTSVTTAELAEFRLWRLDPTNAAAYAKVERGWRQSRFLEQDPEIEAALSRVRTQSKTRRLSRPILISGGTALAAICIAAFLIPLSGATIYETAVGEQSTVTLEDGSRLKLDTNTRIAVRFTENRRSVSLQRGQVLFDVLHRPDRPFQVAIGTTRIDDIGTIFDVRRDADQVRVTLVAGSLRVTKGSSSDQWTLVPDQQVVSGPEGEKVQAIDASKVTSWTSGRLVFENLPLTLATEEVNRYAMRKVVLDAGAIGDIRVSGAFDSSDTDAFVSAVSKLYDLTVQHEADGSILLRSATEKPSV